MEGVVYQFPLRLKYFILQQKLFKQESKGLKKLQEVTETDKIQDPSAFQNKQNKLLESLPEKPSCKDQIRNPTLKKLSSAQHHRRGLDLSLGMNMFEMPDSSEKSSWSPAFVYSLLCWVGFDDTAFFESSASI